MSPVEVPAASASAHAALEGEAAGRPELSIIIVNWSTRDDLLACLDSVEEAVAGLTAEVLVVDNASPDGSGGSVRARFPRVRLIQNRRNAGFARANNQAFALARGRHLLLLNPDTVVNGEALRGLIDFMDRTPRAGAAGLQLRFPDGRLQNSYDSFPTFASELLSKHLMRLLFPARYPSKRVIPEGPIRVDIVIGACLILRPEVVEALGGFDEGYFLFVEEADLCWRIWRAGWEIYHLPHLSIIHDAKASKAQATSHAYIEYARSSYRFYNKSMTPPLAFLLRAAKALKVVLVNPLLSLIASGFTLGRVPRHVRRLKIRARLCAWHLLGCPEPWGMREVSSFLEYERRRGGGRETVVASRAGPFVRGLVESFGGAAGPRSPVRPQAALRVEDPDSGRALRVLSFGARGLLAWLRGLRRVPEGLAILERAVELRDRGIETSLPLAGGIVRRGGLPGFSFAVFEEELDVFTLAAALSRGGPERSHRLAAAGRFLRRLHDAGVDLLSPAGTAVTFREGSAAGDGAALSLGEGVEVALGPPLSAGGRLAALGRIAGAVPGLSPHDRRRFLVSYFGSRHGGRRSLRVLHLFSNHKVTGPAETALEAARALDALPGVRAEFAAGSAPDGAGGLRGLAAERKARVANLGLHLRKHWRPLAVLADARKLRARLREEPPHVIHCHMGGDHLVAALAAPPGMPIVRSFYDGEPPDWDWRARRTLGARAARIACFSEAVRARLAAPPCSIPERRLVRLDPPVDVERFDPARPLPDGRAALGIPPGVFAAGIAARLQTHRRFEVLFTALAIARREVPGLRFVVIGRGTHAETVARRPVEELGLADTVRLAGYLSGDDYVAALRALDAAVFLVPGSDGTCRAVREALAMGLPVIAARRGMLPELVRDGETGLVIDDTPENLARALVRLARGQEERARMAAAARAFAVRHLSLASHARALLSIYRSVLAESGRREPA